MQDHAIQFEPRWTTKEAANSVNISETTIRKYAQTLERKCGYQFHTINKKGDRRFSDHDITLLIEMKRLSEETGMSVTKIAMMVIEKYSHEVSDTHHTESVGETELAVIPQDFHSVIERASQQFWAIARKEIMEDVREVVRQEVRNELRTEMDELRHQLCEIEVVTREMAVSLEKQRKPWWKRGR